MAPASAFLRLTVLFLTLTASVYCECPVAKWGTNCDKDCHCLGGGYICDQLTADCQSNVCESGYINPPKCQTECDPGSFGDGCEFECHCVNDEICNHVNGYCDNGCDPEYTGGGCLNRRTFLGTPPRAIDVTCTNLRVTWLQFNEERATDVSDIYTPVIGYQLEVNVNNTGWRSEGAFRARVSNQENYFHSVNNLQKYTTYRYRVRADGQSEYQKTVLGFPGPESDPVQSACTVPGPVSDVVLTVISFEKIRVSWQAPSSGGALNGYELSYVKRGIGKDGSCQKLSNGQVSRLTLATTTTTKDIDSLDAWSYYNITILAKNGVGNGEGTTLTANTLETGPIGQVTGLNASDVTSTSFTMTWTALPCSQRNGDVTKYVVQYTPIGGSPRTVETVNSVLVNIKDLSPSTMYRVAVQFANKHSATSFSDVLDVRTLPSATAPPNQVPTEPRRLQVVPKPTSMFVSWQPPIPSNGAILQYEVAYRVAGTTGAFRAVSTTSLSHDVTGLTTGTTYNVKVRAQNSNGWGPYTTILEVLLPTVSVVPSQPSTPTPILTSLGSVALKWFPPTESRGTIQGYKVEYVRTNTQHPSASVPSGSVPTTATNVLLNNLDPASTYSVTVSAQNENGYGPPSAAVDVITYPSVPADPPSAQFAMDAQTDTTAPVRVFTVTSPNVAYVDVYVKKVTSSKRRKRANADCTNGGRHQIRLRQNQFTNREMLATLGDNKLYNGVRNSPLEPQTRYQLCTRVVSVYETRQTFSYTPGTDIIITRVTPVSTAGTSPWLIMALILIPLIIIIIIIIIILCILLRRRKQKKSQNLNKTWLNYYNKNYERFDESLPKIQPYGRWSDITEFSQPRHVEHMREPIDPVDPETKTIEQEYKHLPQDQLHPWLVALKPENDVKNRFQQFLPYDHSRVDMRNFDGDNLYVNANYIDGFQKPRAYIAAQSPFDTETVNDFWEMIYHENCQQVIMLCEQVEDGILKCELYWPDDGTRIYRHLAVTLKRTDVFTNYVIRHFDLTPQKKLSKTKTVIQYQFTNWPAHGIPHDPVPYLEFVIKIRTQGSPGAGPQVVHCGTGVSRTAAHIAVDSLMKEGFKTGQVNVFMFCKQMRNQRISMVRTPVQYTFIYDTLFESLMTSDYILDFDMRQTYKRLLTKNNRTGRTELLEQFKILRYYTPQTNEEYCRTALRSQNRAKNRYLNILPPDDIRATIRTPGGVERNDYINAIFLDGHLRSKDFIVTQTPMLATCIDFWKLVYDHKIKTIVMLHDKTFKDDTLQEYWPKGDEMKRYDPFYVTLKSSVKEKDFVVKRYFDLSSAHNRNVKSREVKQFQLFSGWHMYDKIPDRDALLQLLDSVLDERRRLEEDDEKEEHAPILVHCADGATRSGLFCALMILIEKMRCDRYVDIFHTVKHLKRSRPQFIDDFEQYKMTFKALWEHVNTRFKSTYSLSRISKGSHETLDTIGSTRESMLR